MIIYGAKFELLKLMVLWQLGVLVFDDPGGDNRAFRKSSHTC